VQGESLQEAQQLVDGIVEELKAAGVTAEGAVRPSTGGSPAGPSSSTRVRWAGLIVVGSHGHSVLGGLLIGSVAHKLTQLSACPVLVVRDQASLDERHHDVLRAQTRFQS
jgi:nucleotide-binding universal stress UspA family protein